jgi:hypothetical protein
MRKPSNFFLLQSNVPEVGKLAFAAAALCFMWTEELQAQMDAGTLSSKYAGVVKVTPIIGLRYCLLHNGTKVFNPEKNLRGEVVEKISSISVKVRYEDGVEETSPRKDLYKILAEELSEKQLRPVLKGSLRHFNKIVVDFPGIKAERHENFTATVEVDGDIMEEIKLTGDEEADKIAIAFACDKYADPNLDENGFLLIDKYKKTKNEE